MIKLYTFPAAFGLRNVSPFCLKVEMALEHLGLDHEIILESDPRKSPKGKLPYIIDDGHTIADSELIFEYLDAKADGKLFGDISDQEHAIGMAFTRLIEDHLYWIMVASRWLDDSWFDNVREGFFGTLPSVLKPLVSGMARKQMAKTYQLQGLGNHTLEEQANFSRRDFESVSCALKAGGYICGDRLTAYDFSVVGLLAGIYDQQPRSWVNDVADDFPDVKDYATRVQQEVGVYAAR
jgi:glutathione S-transferase